MTTEITPQTDQAKAYVDLDAVPEITERPDLGEAAFSIAGERGTVIMLHGYDFEAPHSPGAAFAPAVQEMNQYFRRHGFGFWAPSYYPKHSFKNVAKTLEGTLRNSAINFNNLHFFGYSMGGLVARQIAAFGLVPQSLTTFCTPHAGILGWIPTPDEGAQSMHPLSQDLARLNADPVDAVHRNRYTFIGLNYVDSWGTRREDDGMATGASTTLFNAVTPPGSYHYWTSIRQGVSADVRAAGEVHGRAQELDEIRPALAIFARRVTGQSDYL